MRLIDADNLKKAINTWDEFACLPNGKLEPFRNLEHPEMFEPYVHLRDILNAINNAPTVEERPQVDNFDVEDFKKFVESRLDMQDLYLPIHFFYLLDEYRDTKAKEADNDNGS